jgi:hypothetical protein
LSAKIPVKVEIRDLSGNIEFLALIGWPVSYSAVEWAGANRSFRTSADLVGGRLLVDEGKRVSERRYGRRSCELSQETGGPSGSGAATVSTIVYSSGRGLNTLRVDDVLPARRTSAAVRNDPSWNGPRGF